MHTLLLLLLIHIRTRTQGNKQGCGRSVLSFFLRSVSPLFSRLHIYYSIFLLESQHPINSGSDYYCCCCLGKNLYTRTRTSACRCAHLPICVCMRYLSIYIIPYKAYIYNRQKIVYLTITTKRKKGSNCFPLIRIHFNFCIVFSPL